MIEVMPNMENQNLVTKVTRTFNRANGSQTKVVAQTMFGSGLTQSIDVYALHRESEKLQWALLDNKPHPNWKSMSREEYIKNGRSELLQHLTHGEILKVVSCLGLPMIEVENSLQ